jgi:polyphosphate kinase
VDYLENNLVMKITWQSYVVHILINQNLQIFWFSWVMMREQVDIFDVIRKGDILVQHPYHSFVTSTQHFVEAASSDPRVLTCL